MKMILFLMSGSLLFGCSKSKTEQPQSEVDNTVTRYVDTLHNDVEKARQAAALANNKIKQTQTVVNEAVENQ